MTRSTSATPRRLDGLRLTLTGLVVAVAAALTLTVQAQPMRGHGMGMMDGGHGMGMMHGPTDGRRIDRMLDGLNATDAQRAQIKQITDAAAADLKAQRDAGQALRDRAMQIFTAPTVDANAAEALRQQMQSQRDQASRRMLQAMLDISRVLTPEQRAKIAERMKQRSDAMRERMQRMERQRPAQ